MFDDPYQDNAVTAKVRAAIHQYLTRVRGAGPDNIVACCPFHDDNTPSFSMCVHNGLYICFGCGETGNFRSFLARMGLGPSEIKYHYGATLEQIRQNAPPPPDPTHPNVIMETNRHIPEELLGLFHFCPIDLLDEGFTEATLLDFGVGVDKFNDRITYPLRDFKGNLVGISGRAMREDQEERYKVYREEYTRWELPPYNTDKALLLWNAHRVFPAVYNKPDAGPIVIVEGFKACMWLKQAGVPNVVALMTKAMSWTQAWLLRHMGNNHVLMLDNDNAGIAGTINASEELIKSSPHLRIVEYEEAQPTDVPLEDIPGLIENATPEVLFALL